MSKSESFKSCLKHGLKIDYFSTVLDHPLCDRFAREFLKQKGPTEFKKWKQLKSYLKDLGFSKELIKAGYECWDDWRMTNRELEEFHTRNRSGK